MAPSIQVEPFSVRYVSADTVEVTMKRSNGEPIAITMTVGAMVKLVNLSVATMNKFGAEVLRDLGIF